MRRSRTLPDGLHRLCVKCGETKPIEEFYDSGKGGKASKCKPCKVEYNRERLARNPEQFRAIANAHRRAWRKRNPGSSPADRRKHLARYGLTEESYLALWNAQGGVCAICFKPETLIQYGKPQRLCIDHCHETGVVRGLLCTRCNKGIGLIGDTAAALHHAAAYLARYETRPATSHSPRYGMAINGAA